MPTDAALAAQVMERIDALAAISDEPDRLTRTYGSPAMRRANELAAGWMHEAGLVTHVDAIGNLIGHYAGTQRDAKTFLLGSHLDTVRDAGRFDGPLGVLVALACVQRLQADGRRLPFHLGIAGFADEEGVRFQTTYLGSRALAGTLMPEDLKRTDADGICLRDAMLHFGGDPAGLHGARFPSDGLVGYAEVHIEQGPVLQSRNAPVGLVTGIAGQSRLRLTFTGHAAHAGTTPMSARRDALAGAAEFIARVESLARQEPGLVATVGQVTVEPNVSNVIPARARLSLDVRHAEDSTRVRALAGLRAAADALVAARGLGLDWDVVQETPAVRCDPVLTARMREAARTQWPEVPELASGAGHDAAALASVAPVTMLFVRCRDGVSHHPSESVREDDVAVAIGVLSRFLELVDAARPG